jgi:hypothetical protein
MREELESTTRAVIAADKVHLGRVAEEALWERRGFLRSLARTHQRETGWWRRALRLN